MSKKEIPVSIEALIQNNKIIQTRYPCNKAKLNVYGSFIPAFTHVD